MGITIYFFDQDINLLCQMCNIVIPIKWRKGESKVVFKRLIRHKGFLKIHLEHRPTNVMQILGSWPSGSFCFRRTLILIFLVVLWIHICWLKTTFCCFKPLFQLSYFSIWWGLFKILIRLMYTTNFEVEGGNLQWDSYTNRIAQNFTWRTKKPWNLTCMYKRIWKIPLTPR